VICAHSKQKVAATSVAATQSLSFAVEAIGRDRGRIQRDLLLTYMGTDTLSSQASN
jgi:hypothetical protein